MRYVLQWKGIKRKWNLLVRIHCLYKEQVTVRNFPQATRVFPDSVFHDIKSPPESNLEKQKEKKQTKQIVACKA